MAPEQLRAFLDPADWDESGRRRPLRARPGPPRAGDRPAARRARARAVPWPGRSRRSSTAGSGRRSRSASSTRAAAVARLDHRRSAWPSDPRTATRAAELAEDLRRFLDRKALEHAANTSVIERASTGSTGTGRSWRPRRSRGAPRAGWPLGLRPAPIEAGPGSARPSPISIRAAGRLGSGPRPVRRPSGGMTRRPGPALPGAGPSSSGASPTEVERPPEAGSALADAEQALRRRLVEAIEPGGRPVLRIAARSGPIGVRPRSRAG